MSDLVIGIDVGTTTVKSAAFDPVAMSRPVAVERRPSATYSTRGERSEVEPEQVEQAVYETLQVLGDRIDRARVVGVGITGTACGAWLTDRDGKAVRPAIMWNDGRAAEITRAWGETDTLDRIFDISGNVPFPGYTLPVLAWLDAHEPRSREQADVVLFCKDWLRLRLTGVVATEASEASYVPFDIVRRAWSDELFEITGTTAWRSLLPELLPPDSTQPLSAEGAQRTGLKAGTPISMGATDIVAGLVGAGASRVGRTVSILGTSANSTLVADDPPWEPRGVGIMAASPMGRYARSLINTSGSATLDWGARLLSGGDIDAFLRLAELAPEGAAGLVTVPYLSPAGTVSPRVDPHATGMLAGLRVHHGPEHLARSIVEGLALSVADCYAHMRAPVMEIVAVGGAARSDMLLQALADLADRPVIRLVGDEFGARGAAVLAAWSIGTTTDLDGLAGAVEQEARFEPRPDSPLTGRLAQYQDLASHNARDRRGSVT